MWVDRNGEAEIVATGSGHHWYPRISPDGRYLAYMRGPSGKLDLWVRDLQRGVPRRLTFRGGNGPFVWSPDNERIVFSSYGEEGSVLNLYSVARDLDPPEPQRLTWSDRGQWPSTWSRNGVLAFDRDYDIWVLPMEDEGAGEPWAFLDSPSREVHPAFSPDGNWLAYASNETGQSEVYVRPYPGPGAAIIISTEGGLAPAWSRDGRELFYRETDSRMMAVDVDVTGEGAFTAGSPRLLFEGRYYSVQPVRHYDVTSDGRFLMLETREPSPQPATELRLVLNLSLIHI